MVRKLEGEIRRMDDRRSQHTMHRRCRPEPHGRIEIVLSQSGCAARRIGNAGLHADAVSRLQFRYGRTDLDDLAGRLMSEDHRLLDHERTDGSMSVVVYVTTADTDRSKSDPDIPRSQCFLDRDITQAEFVLALQHQRLHDPLSFSRVPSMHDQGKSA